MITVIKKIKKNQSVLIAFFELILGAVLLAWEIRDFITLPSTTEMDKMYGGLVDLFKYKENTYSFLFLWTILLFAGISYWINKKLHWTFNQILSITVFFAVEFILGLVLLDAFVLFNPIAFAVQIFLFVGTLLLFIWIEKRMFRKIYLKNLKIGSQIKWFSIVLGIISAAIYFLIEYYLIFG